MGTIPDYKGGKKRKEKIIWPDELPFSVAEAIYQLRTAILYSSKDVKMIAVTSAFENQGKSFISFHLAYSLSQVGKRVLLVDTDMRKSVLQRRMGLEGVKLGLSEYLSGNAEVGQVVAAGQTVLTLVHDGDMEVQIDVPENKLSELTVGTSVTVNFWALGDVTADGIVREVAPMADAASRTYKVRVSIPNPPDGMELGMTATVATAAAAGTMDVVLPTSAIYQTGDTPKVWVVSKDDTVSLVDISVEELGNDTVKVKGLHRGDTIVAAGAQMLHEGQHVRTESDTQ